MSKMAAAGKPGIDVTKQSKAGLFERFRDERFPESCPKAMKQRQREQHDRSERQESVAIFLRSWRRQEFQPEFLRHLHHAQMSAFFPCRHPHAATCFVEPKHLSIFKPGVNL
jgi:hypothetical protein